MDQVCIFYLFNLFLLQFYTQQVLLSKIWQITIVKFVKAFKGCANTQNMITVEVKFDLELREKPNLLKWLSWCKLSSSEYYILNLNFFDKNVRYFSFLLLLFQWRIKGIHEALWEMKKLLFYFRCVALPLIKTWVWRHLKSKSSVT